MIKYTFYFLVAALIALGSFVAYERQLNTQIPFFVQESTSVWFIEAKVEFKPQKNAPILVTLNIPDKVPGYKIFFEQSSSAGYGFSVVDDATQKKAQWSIREASSKQTLFYKIQVAKEAIHRARKKLPCSFKVVVEKNKVKK